MIFPCQVLTCVCPNAKVVLTAGTSSVVAVYEYHKKVKSQLNSQFVKWGVIHPKFSDGLLR